MFLLEPFQAIEVAVEHLGEDEELLDQAQRRLAVAEAVQVGDRGAALLCAEGVDDFFYRPVECAIALCAAEGDSQLRPQAVERLGLGEQVALHPFQWGADAVLQLMACVDQILNRLLSADVSAVCGEHRRVAMVECGGKALKHTSVRKAQNTSLSYMKYVGHVTGGCHWIQPERYLSENEIKFMEWVLRVFHN